MEIILKQDIKGLGYAHDVVKVKPGYGRNFLIPRGYAAVANESNKKTNIENIKQAAHKVAQIKKEAQAIAEKVEGLTIDIGAKVGDNDKIFGSITTAQIAAKLKLKGFEVDRKRIIMDDSPKEVGTYAIVLDLHKEIKCKVNVNVVAE